MEHKKRLSVKSLFVAIILLFVFAATVMVEFISNHEKYQGFAEVDALITNITRSNTDETKLIEYQYKYNGKKYISKRDELFAYGKKIGDTVTIKCNPEDPSEIQDSSNTFFLIMIFMFSFPAVIMFAKCLLCSALWLMHFVNGDTVR